MTISETERDFINKVCKEYNTSSCSAKHQAFETAPRSVPRSIYDLDRMKYALTVEIHETVITREQLRKMARTSEKMADKIKNEGYMPEFI